MGSVFEFEPTVGTLAISGFDLMRSIALNVVKGGGKDSEAISGATVAH